MYVFSEKNTHSQKNSLFIDNKSIDAVSYFSFEGY